MATPKIVHIDNVDGVDSKVKTMLNVTGDAPMGVCRAWVYFNGVGTVTIKGSMNVSSITDNGVGNYSVNLTTPMIDSNYVVLADKQDIAVINNGHVNVVRQDNSLNFFSLQTVENGVTTDTSWISAAVFR